jgi:hypothetical protein
MNRTNQKELEAAVGYVLTAPVHSALATRCFLARFSAFMKRAGGKSDVENRTYTCGSIAAPTSLTLVYRNDLKIRFGVPNGAKR